MQNTVGKKQVVPRSTPAQKVVELLGIVVFMALALLIGHDVFSGAVRFGFVWLLPVVAVLAYLAADFVSGFAHFLLDNFGDAKTPLFGRYFIKPFRDHHVDPLGITRNDFIDTNGNNSLASVIPMLLVWLLVPIETNIAGYLFGTFFLLLCVAVLLTNQFHKWAHMDAPPAWAAWLQRRGVILSKEHHDIHHDSPYDTYYCITVGVWNPLFDRIHFFERTERLIRRYIPGTDSQLRVDREGSLNE